jgi:hypothetical protein
MYMGIYANMASLIGNWSGPIFIDAGSSRSVVSRVDQSEFIAVDLL